MTVGWKCLFMLTSSIKFIRIYSWFIIKTATLIGNLRPIYITVLHMSLWAATRTSLWMALLIYLSEVCSQALVSKHHLLSEVSHTVKVVLYYISVSACKCAVYFVFLTPNSDFCFCFLHFLHLDYKCTLWSGVHYSAQVFKSHFNHSGCDVTPKQLWGFIFDPFP